MICANFGAFTTKPTFFSQICCTIIDVDYNACSGEALRSRCSESETVSLYNSGYITSPNYPDKYYTDIRTSTTFGRHESHQLPGQVLHGNPDIRTSTTYVRRESQLPGQVLHGNPDIRTSTTYVRRESQLPGQVLHGCRVPVCRVPVYVITNNEYN